tara:strand:- start:1004 stop:1309 length:306 start_codon:yes stop_codon:yes gene_type:complete
MSKKQETLFKEQLMPKLRDIPTSWWFKTQQLALLGIPDVIGCVNGKFCALELKRHKGASITKLQIYVLKLIKKSNGYSRIVHPDNYKSVLRELEKISQLSI